MSIDCPLSDTVQPEPISSAWPSFRTSPVPSGAQPHVAEPKQATRYRILVVDDNRDAATTLAMLLKLKGYDVHTRNSGREGIEATANLQPDIVILDIGMPGLDGYQTCRLIRQQPSGRDRLLIALTGYGQDEDKRRSEEAGFDRHMVKPLNISDLIQLLGERLPR